MLTICLQALRNLTGHTQDLEARLAASRLREQKLEEKLRRYLSLHVETDSSDPHRLRVSLVTTREMVDQYPEAVCGGLADQMRSAILRHRDCGVAARSLRPFPTITTEFWDQT